MAYQLTNVVKSVVGVIEQNIFRFNRIKAVSVTFEIGALHWRKRFIFKVLSPNIWKRNEVFKIVIAAAGDKVIVIRNIELVTKKL